MRAYVVAFVAVSVLSVAVLADADKPSITRDDRGIHINTSDEEIVYVNGMDVKGEISHLKNRVGKMDLLLRELLNPSTTTEQPSTLVTIAQTKPTEAASQTAGTTVVPTTAVPIPATLCSAVDEMWDLGSVYGAAVATGSTVLAVSSTDSNEQCDDEANRQVHFLWTAPGNGTYDFHTSQSKYDTRLALYTPTGCTILECNDDGDDDEGFSTLKAGISTVSDGFMSRIVVEDVEAGTSYRIAVGGYEADEAGDFVLNIGFEPRDCTGLGCNVPDPCFSNIVPIDLGNNVAIVSGSTAGATSVIESVTGCGASRQVHYAWRPSKTCKAEIYTKGNSYDTRLQVLSHTCSSLQCNDDCSTFCAGKSLDALDSYVTLDVIKDQYYVIAVGGYKTENAGSFNLHIVCN